MHLAVVYVQGSVVESGRQRRKPGDLRSGPPVPPRAQCGAHAFAEPVCNCRGPGLARLVPGAVRLTGGPVMRLSHLCYNDDTSDQFPSLGTQGDESVEQLIPPND